MLCAVMSSTYAVELKRPEWDSHNSGLSLATSQVELITARITNTKINLAHITKRQAHFTWDRVNKVGHNSLVKNSERPQQA